MTIQSQLEAELSKHFAEFEHDTLPSIVRETYRSLTDTRMILSDILGRHSVDGRIPRTRATAIMNEMPAYERALVSALEGQFRTNVEQATTESTTALVSSLVAVIGPTAVLAFVGVTSAEQAAEVLLAEAGFALLFGKGVAQFISEVMDAVFRRTDPDGKQLRQRITIFSTQLRVKIEEIIRTGIRNGQSVDAILRKVDQLMKDDKWKLDRLSGSEGLNAYRTAVAESAKDASFVKGVRIIDFPHAPYDAHKRHECYILARQDEHGLGKGVYPPTVRKVRNPHPNCRSILVPVIEEEAFNA